MDQQIEKSRLILIEVLAGELEKSEVVANGVQFLLP
jgi:hypothetical protein